MASEANEVGESGEKKVLSCPATKEVSFQSMRMLATRMRTKPRFTPFGVFGDPPEKSNCRFPEVRAPARRGPNTSRPISDCRRVAPNVCPDTLGISGIAHVGVS